MKTMTRRRLAFVSDNGGAHGSDLYLDTVCISCLFVRAISNLRQVNRAALDFDFEKVLFRIAVKYQCLWLPRLREILSRERS